jgi:hypothetical protein
MVSRPSMTELPTFKVLSEQLRCKHHRRRPDLRRGEAYLSFGSILANLEVSKENAMIADQGQDVIEFFEENGT